MSMSIVLNNQERPVVCQFKATHPKSADPEANRANALIPGETLLLLPGVNFVPTDKLTKLRGESRQVASMFTDKIKREKFQEGPPPERWGKPKLEVLVEKDVDPKAPFAKLKLEQVTQIIDNTFDERLLEQWVKASGVESVRAQLYRQIEYVKTGRRDETEVE